MKIVAICVCICLFAAMLPLTAHSGGGPQTAPAGPIPVVDIQARGIAGVLGEPLGKPVNIHGVLLDRSTLNLSKGEQEETFIRVDRINERKFAVPVLIQLADRPQANVKAPLLGHEVTCSGYETGGYNGMVYPPRRPSDPPNMGPPAFRRYGFTTSFVLWEMTSNNSPRGIQWHNGFM